MKLGFFIMPVHPPARQYAETLKEDREALILATGSATAKAIAAST